MTPAEVLLGETGLSYGESVWLLDRGDGETFHHYTVAEFRPGDWYTDENPTTPPLIIFHADGDPRWPLTLDLGTLNEQGWYTLCAWRPCNTLVHSANIHRFPYRQTKEHKLMCEDHSEESRSVGFDADAWREEQALRHNEEATEDAWFHDE